MGRASEPAACSARSASDWTLATVVTLQSGMPIAVTQTTNFNAFAGFGTQRPNLVGDPELPADERTPSRWFNTAAFAIAPQFTLGTASRNPVRGPAYRNVDLALSRRVPAGQRDGARAARRGVQPVEHAALGAPAASQGAANSGRSRRRSIRVLCSSPSNCLSNRCGGCIATQSDVLASRTFA